MICFLMCFYYQIDGSSAGWLPIDDENKVCLKSLGEGAFQFFLSDEDDLFLSPETASGINTDHHRRRDYMSFSDDVEPGERIWSDDGLSVDFDPKTEKFHIFSVGRLDLDHFNITCDGQALDWVFMVTNVFLYTVYLPTGVFYDVFDVFWYDA